MVLAGQMCSARPGLASVEHDRQSVCAAQTVLWNTRNEGVAMHCMSL